VLVGYWDCICSQQRAGIFNQSGKLAFVSTLDSGLGYAAGICNFHDIYLRQCSMYYAAAAEGCMPGCPISFYATFGFISLITKIYSRLNFSHHLV
jgi:hypothetical protein